MTTLIVSIVCSVVSGIVSFYIGYRRGWDDSENYHYWIN